jgi:fatty-acyl-CoA synthase
MDPPGDEWESIAINYTSGTTGRPKGVVYHHRGAYLATHGQCDGWRMTAVPGLPDHRADVPLQRLVPPWMVPRWAARWSAARDITARRSMMPSPTKG